MVMLVTALSGFGSSRPAPAPGSPDVSFGRGGMVTTGFGRGELAEAVAGAVAVQSDGRLVVAGSARLGEERRDDFALARYNRNGTLDRTFGRGGKVTTDFATGSEFAAALVVQRDGKIVAAGGASTDPEIDAVDFALVRYNRDGSLDRTFGNDGRVTTDFAGGFDRIHALVLQPDGKLVAAGWASTSPDRGWDDVALARYNRDGSLDRTFGDGGRVSTDLGTSEYANALALQRDGKLVAAGVIGADFGLVRYHRDGTLDRSFGDGGHVVTDFGYYYDAVNAVAVLRDGRVVAAGRTDTNPSGDVALARYLPDGTLDTTFGRGGTTYLGFNDYANALVVQPDGKLLAAGYSGIFCFEADGAVDATFGVDGFVATDYAPYAAALQPDGKLVLAGVRATERTDGSYEIVFAVARYHTRMHRLD